MVEMEANTNRLLNGCNWVDYIENNKIAVVIDSDVLEVWLQFVIVDYQVYVDLKVPIGIQDMRFDIVQSHSKSSHMPNGSHKIIGHLT
jgi:hypothetical protein